MRNIIGNEPPEKALAQADMKSGRAIIETPDGYVYSLEISGDEVALHQQSLGFHPGMWLQPAMARCMGSPIAIIEAGEHPFMQLVATMRLQKRRYDAVDMFLFSCDTDLGSERQRHAGERLEVLLQEDAVRSAIEPAILGVPFPEGLSRTGDFLTGRGKELLDKVIAKWG